MVTASNSSDAASPGNSSDAVVNLTITSLTSVTIQSIAGMVLTKLNRQNYITWRSLFLLVLKCFKLLGVINGEDL